MEGGSQQLVTPFQGGGAAAHPCPATLHTPWRRRCWTLAPQLRDPNTSVATTVS
ncbi:hypothetical protein Fmac_011622 [Flemingia macrophylla]|uniref:Uncharacterized protein n=1 Tax=Flemingia macrophylla TaxID=520843 RepID=A0ABD1MMY3_9FABA